MKTKFIDNDDGTVTDTRSGRMWMKNDSWQALGRHINWVKSHEFAKEMNEKKFAGYSNWRIPNTTEAKSLYEEGKTNTDKEGCEIRIDPIFPSGCGFTIWTSETRGARSAMGYDFREDYEFWLAKEDEGFPSTVRLVRTLK